jgi:hypothetical protein
MAKVQDKFEKVRGDWLIKRTIAANLELRLWITGSTKDRLRFEVLDGEGIQRFMPDSEYDESPHVKSNPTNMPKPLRDCQHKEAFNEMISSWNQTNE